MIKNMTATQETWVRFLGWEDSLEEEMATHSSCLEKILLTQKFGRLNLYILNLYIKYMGSKRVRHNRARKHAFLMYSPEAIQHY